MGASCNKQDRTIVMSDLKYGIAYKTELSIKEIEDWMKKKVELFFEIAEDKENFKSNFSKRK